MKQIIITLPNFFDGEAEAITALFEGGLELLHLRKPEAGEEDVKQLLERIPAKYHTRIVLHGHFRLTESYNVKGIHLNRRNSGLPQGYKGQISCSCHSLEEVRRRKETCDYVFLSPIFDSISKAGYASAFTPEELMKARKAGIIDEKVIALGGINAERLPQVKAMGFGGAAMLGDAWSHKIVLSIAGSDSSGGAGIQADIKAISALGGYAASVITAVTAQNTQGVQGIYPMPGEAVRQQIEAVMNDLSVDAIKIGMVFDKEIVHAIAGCLKRHRPKHVVFDPVMISTSGRKLMVDDTIRIIKEELIPLSTLITPNLHEAALLLGKPVNGVEEMEQAALSLARQFRTSILIKGGHLEGHAMCDVLCHYPSGTSSEEECILSRHTLPKIESKNLHGTGCTLSAAIATLLAQGYAMEQAVGRAKAYLNRAIAFGKGLQIGHANGPVWHFPPIYP